MRRLAFLVVIVAIYLFARNAGRLLVVEDLRKADAIVVLEGETDRRPAQGLKLLQEGYAPRALLDASPNDRVYEWTQAELSQQYIRTLPPQISRAVSMCPITGQSTMEEAVQVGQCLDAAGARSLLLVTSQYHTRRALSIFRHRLPDRQIGVAGAAEPREFGVEWWRHRQWAKVTLGEWVRLLWWECVDRWR